MLKSQFDGAISSIESKIEKAKIEHSNAEALVLAQRAARNAERKVRNLECAKTELETLRNEDIERLQKEETGGKQ